LGGTPFMELMIAARKAVRELQGLYGLAVDRIYTGSFMTSLDMAGTCPLLCFVYSSAIILAKFHLYSFLSSDLKGTPTLISSQISSA
jgi:Dak1 domain